MFKKLFDKMTTPTSSTINTMTTGTVVVPATGTTMPSTVTTYPSTVVGTTGVISTIAPTFVGGIAGGYSYLTAGTGITSMGATYAPSPNADIIKLSSPVANKEIVKLTKDGEVIWADGIKIDEAAEAFGRSIALAAEQRAGITNKVKYSMRDSVFNDLISIAKEKGALTAEDLTYLLEASKIVEKLKGA